MDDVTLAQITVSSKFDLAEVETSLRKWGAAVLPGWLNKEDVQNLLMEWQQIRDLRLDENSPWVEKIGGDAADYAALYMSRLASNGFETVKKAFFGKELFKLASQVVGRPMLFNHDIYATYDEGQDKEIVSSHFDKTWNLKFMVYLEDILEPGLGAFGVHPGSHQVARNRFRDWFEKNQSKGRVLVGTPSYYEMDNDFVPDNISNCVDIFAPAGSLIIFSTDVYHRGGFLKKGANRKILRSHSHPGLKPLCGNDEIKRKGHQWLRGEDWEKNKLYNRFFFQSLYERLRFKKKIVT